MWGEFSCNIKTVANEKPGQHFENKMCRALWDVKITRWGALWTGSRPDAARQFMPDHNKEQQSNGCTEQVGGGTGSRQAGQPQQMVEPVQGRNQQHALAQGGKQGGTAGIAGGLQEIDAQIVQA